MLKMDIKSKKIWVLWKLEERQGKKTKVPYQPNGKLASTTDPTTWSTYKQVKEAVGSFSGIGLVFEPSVNVIGVDFDKKVDSPFFELAKTYVEYSPSKTGMHLLFIAKEPIELERNKKTFPDGSAIEIYTGGRYFTYTENEHESSLPIREVTSDEFISLISTLGYPWKAQNAPQRDKPTPTNLSDQEVLKKAFGAKNGKDIEALYNGDTSQYSNDESAADFALCMHLAFWTGKDKERMRSLWLNSPLGSRKKTQDRTDYQDRTLDNAINATTEVYTPRSSAPITHSDSKEIEFLMTGGKNPHPVLNLENICRILASDDAFSSKFRLNDFSHMVETKWDSKDWVNLFDNAITEVQRVIQTKYPDFMAVSRAMVQDGIMSLAYHNRVNPPRDFMKSLVWDKVPRLNSWLHTVYGVVDDDLNQAMGSNWIKGLVKRVMIPGCQFDEVLALESPQGWRKSTSIKEIGFPWHVETTHSMDDKDFFMQVSQNILVEFSEGDIFDKASVKKLKAEITKTEDQFRPPYERGMMKFKRGCVFAVTTNKLELKDETGNRRWLPVELQKIADIEWIKANRDQLFAEAYHRVMVLGETTYEYPKDELEDLQASRMESGDNDEKLLLWYVELDKEKQEEGFPLRDAINYIYPNMPPDKKKEWEISNILKRTLCLESRNTKINGAVLKRWKPTDKTWKIIKDINKF
jgi:predicted P-loop ATPase